MVSTPQRSFSSFARPAPHLLAGSIALAGSALIAAGVPLPWLSLFAGLQPISALGTPNGALLFLGAAASGLLGTYLLLRDGRWARRALAVAGIASTGFTAYLVVGLVALYRDLSADPLMVAQLGPGLLLVAIGSIALVGTALIRD